MVLNDVVSDAAEAEYIRQIEEERTATIRGLISRGYTAEQVAEIVDGKPVDRSDENSHFSKHGTEKNSNFTENKEISDSEAEKPRFSKQKNADTEAIEQEMADIKAKAEKEGTFMKAPNGKSTKLNERQWLQVRTKAFKDWFGDWEKSARIEKLKGADDVVISGIESEIIVNLCFFDGISVVGL